MIIGLFNKVLSFTNGGSSTASGLKKKTYWAQARKLFKYDVELLEAWEKAILEDASDWELFYFYDHVSVQYDLIESLKNIKNVKRIQKSHVKVEKESYEDPNKYRLEKKFTDPQEVEEERERIRKMIFIYKHSVNPVQIDRQVAYRELAKLGTMQGIYGFEQFLSGYNPIHPYKYQPDLEELGIICLNPGDLPKDRRKQLEVHYEVVNGFKFRSKASKEHWNRG